MLKHIEPIEQEKIYEQYVNFLKNYTVIVNPTDLAFYWPKYGNECKIDSFSDINCGNLDFQYWLSIYRKHGGNIELERIDEK